MNKEEKENMKEIQPTKTFYRIFKLYAPDRKCKECGQIIKSKRPDVKFFLVGKTKGGFLKVKQSNRKNISVYHRKFFNLT